jgi:hypothetical protein
MSEFKPHFSDDHESRRNASYRDEHPSYSATRAEEPEAGNEKTNGTNSDHEGGIGDEDFGDVKASFLQRAL